MSGKTKKTQQRERDKKGKENYFWDEMELLRSTWLRILKSCDPRKIGSTRGEVLRGMIPDHLTSFTTFIWQVSCLRSWLEEELLKSHGLRTKILYTGIWRVRHNSIKNLSKTIVSRVSCLHYWSLGNIKFIYSYRLRSVIWGCSFTITSHRSTVKTSSCP